MEQNNVRLCRICTNNFITLKAKEKDFMSLSGEGKRQAVEYMIRAKKALEDNGAIVLIVREGGADL